MISHTIATHERTDHPVYYHDDRSPLAWRARTIFTKEPATTKWVGGGMRPGVTLWDIGACVGGYTMIAAAMGATVVAIEPMRQNFVELCRNLDLNITLGSFPEGRVLPINAGITERGGFLDLHLSSPEPGSSCHSLGDAVSFTGNPKEFPTRQRSYSFEFNRLFDELVHICGEYAPTAIKLDVDGFEARIVSAILKNETARTSIETAIVELSSSHPEHALVFPMMAAAGFDYDNDQWVAAQRQDGPFKGVGECVFTKTRGSDD